MEIRFCYCCKDLLREPHPRLVKSFAFIESYRDYGRPGEQRGSND